MNHRNAKLPAGARQVGDAIAVDGERGAGFVFGLVDRGVRGEIDHEAGPRAVQRGINRASVCDVQPCAI